jgi:P4 family phage/plasmid primase-like protien
MTTKEAARRYTEAGLHVIPIRGDGSKKAALTTWKPYQSRPATQEELDDWFDGHEDRGVAILGGNGLEILDFDRAGLFEEFEALVEEQAPGLVERLPRVATPRPGVHLYYRCEDAGPSQKLANDENGETLIETRGEGGYVVAPPSPACCHPTNRSYVQAGGPDLAAIPRIEPAERNLLLSVARSFDRKAKGDLLSVKARVRMAEEYVDNAPLARSGCGGHDTTYKVARQLRNDLALPKEVGRALLDRYNDRLEEPWTEKELDHKWDSADGDHPDFPYGCATTNRLPASATDPHGLAKSFIERHPWVYWHGLHFEHDGKKYHEVPEQEVRALLTAHIKGCLDEDYWMRARQYQEDLRSHGSTTRPPVRPAVSRALVGNTLQALEGLTLQRGHVDMPALLSLGGESNLLAVDNGLLDLDSGELRGHTADWFSTVCLPYAYHPNAACPHWLTVLGTNLEADAERIALLQEFFGYALVHSTDAQRCLILIGEGGNGKSVVLAGLHALLGDENVSTVPLEDFGRRFAMAQTLGKLANIVAEVGELDRTAEGTLKAFVSGDRMSFERKGKDPFTARPTARLVLSTNNLPRFADKSEGVWRRLCLVPFNRHVHEQERVPGMDKPEWWLKHGEVPGILNWALDGLKRLRGNGMRFTEPASCRAALEAHRRESDPCREFLVEHYAADDNGQPLRTAEVYDAYTQWCAANGQRHPLTAQAFGRQVRRVFGLEESRNHRFGTGVGKAWFRLTGRTAAVT